MGDAGPGAVAGQEDAEEVAVLVQPRLGSAAAGVGGHPPERRPGVIVGDGERMLGGKAVVDGDDEEAGLCDEGVDEPKVGGREGGLRTEAAAVVVDEDRKLLVWFGGQVREVEASGEGDGRVDGDVLGRHARARVDGCWDGLSADEALDAAALVNADDREEFEMDFFVGIHC